MKTTIKNLNNLIKLATEEPTGYKSSIGDTKCIPLGIWIKMTKKEKIELLENIEKEIGKFEVDHFRLCSPFIHIHDKRYILFLYFNIYNENFDPKSLEDVVNSIYEIQVNIRPLEPIY